MRKVVEALRLLFDQDRSQREIATILALSQSTVHEYLRRFRASGLAWPLPADLDEGALAARLFTRAPQPPAAMRPRPDWAVIHQELTQKGVTLQLLWIEYKAAAPEPARCYQYTQFCRHYHAWAGTLEPVLRQVYVAGERLFVDYAGPTMPIVHPRTGEISHAQIFVGALGASHLIYTEATWTQTLPDMRHRPPPTGVLTSFAALRTAVTSPVQSLPKETGILRASMRSRFSCESVTQSMQMTVSQRFPERQTNV